MDIRVLRYFIEVVQLNGFSRAADTLFITQPAISRSIKKLEDELGTVLLIREVDGVKLTDDGAILYEHAKQILAQFNSMNKALNDKDEPLTGALNVGLPPVIASTYFADIIMAFSSRHPNVELKIFELGTKQMEDAMLEGTVETAAVMLPFNDKDFELTIFSEDFRINDLVRSACGIYNIEPQIVGRSNHLDLIIAMVKAGVGITLLPNSMCNKYPIDDLVVIPITSPRLSYQLALATNQNSYQSRSCQAWNKLAIEKLMKENI
ncbi:LysR family transcriptional regulator [Proteus mirabilis]|uniref:LysR family transcriptional regulator n=1 Tax=Proteus mirabilis TaxID=584 RepID=UPI003F1D9130